MKPLRFALGVLLLSACSDPITPPEPEGPDVDVTGEACAAQAADCRLVTAHQLYADAWRLWSSVPADSGLAYRCPVSRETLDHADFGRYWRCDWAVPVPGSHSRLPHALK
jgi:hypothetical protein